MIVRHRIALRFAPFLAVATACGGPGEASKTAADNTTPAASAPPVATAAPASPPPAQTSPLATTVEAQKAAVPAALVAKSVDLPGAPKPLSFDYLASDRVNGKVYLAVGNTGSLDVFDIASGAFAHVDGFKTAEREWKGKKRTMGPSAAALGEGVIYVGNRATGEICIVNTASMKLGACLKLKSGSDGIAYVASTKELWATTPKDQTLTVLDASKPELLKVKSTIKLPGDPEGYAIDAAHGVFYTNLEDKGPTLAIDLKTHAVKSSWDPGCGSEGPRGVAVDAERNFVFVACTDHLQVLDAGKNGAPIAKLDTGHGVDNIDYVAETHELIISAGKDAQVMIARFDDKGEPTIVARGASAAGARNAVGDKNGNAYVPSPEAGALLIFTRP